MKIISIFIVAVTTLAFVACSSPTATSNKAEEAMPFTVLAGEFKQSNKATTDKYKGKNLSIKGFAATDPILPTGADDVGILVITQPGGDLTYMLSCQFSAAEKEKFAKLGIPTFVTVSGKYDDDEVAMRLTDCRVIEEHPQ